MKSTTRSFAALLLALVLGVPTTSAQDDAAVLQVQTVEEDIVTALTNRGDFTILVDALRSTDLDDALASGETYTLFAPTDAAFEKLPAGTLEGLTPEQLTGILRYHVLVGAASSEDAAALDAAPSVQGSDLTFYASDAGLTVNGATITEADVQASNGVIHVIDTVLIPEADAPMEEDMMEEDMMGEKMEEEHEDHMHEKTMEDESSDDDTSDDADTSAEQILPTDDQR